ncbi:hypothetical protein WA158_001466 [Blastocystis sp. Blastoise]
MDRVSELRDSQDGHSPMSNDYHQRRLSSVSGILIRDDDYSSIELGDFQEEPLIPLRDRNGVKNLRTKSERKLKFNDELGSSLEEVHYADHLVYTIPEPPKPSCCSIL